MSIQRIVHAPSGGRCSVTFLFLLLSISSSTFILSIASGSPTRAALVLSPSRIRNNLNNREPPRDHVLTSAAAAGGGGGVGRMVTNNSSRTAKDDLSRNITNLLENLLKDYDSSHHPGYDSGQPTVVKSNILVRSMGPFSEHRMDYSMDCYFRQSWQDKRLAFNGPIETLSLSIKMLEGIWKPDTFFYNGKKSYLHLVTTPNKLLRITKDGSILYSVRLTIKAKCSMDLREFPMDHQSCPLILGSYGYSEDELIYVWDKQGVKFLSDVELSQFDLMSSPYRNTTISRKQDRYSVLQVSFNLRRKQGYFLIQVYVPCILIVVLSWVSFWLNREATSDRVSLGITTVLTLSTLALDTRTDLPKVHYATALDKFIFITFGYCMATLIQFASVHYFTKIGSGENDQTQDITVLHRKLMELQRQRRSQAAHQQMMLMTTPRPSPSPTEHHHHGHHQPHIANRNNMNMLLTVNPTPPGPPTTPNLDPERESMIPRQQQQEQFTHASSSSAATTVGGGGGGGEEMRLNIDANVDAAENDDVPVGTIRINRRHMLPSDEPSCLRQMLYCLTGNQGFRQRRKRQALAKGTLSINSVSNIDRSSRILFPFTFLLINCFYWWGYVTKDDLFTWNHLDRYKFY